MHLSISSTKTTRQDNLIEKMEHRLNKKVDTYMMEFKDSIRDKASSLGLVGDEIKLLLEHVYDYDRVNLTKDDFSKRKRVKNMVPFFDRCCAKRASGEQCTRRKKKDCEYCGTHTKGIPHGVVDDQQAGANQTQKIEVWAQDIQGIIYYIDKNGNVYQTEDILSNRVNPKIIAKYVKNGEQVQIPAFGL